MPEEVVGVIYSEMYLHVVQFTEGNPFCVNFHSSDPTAISHTHTRRVQATGNRARTRRIVGEPKTRVGACTDVHQV